MKIVQVNTYDIQGGAARAAYRLHKGLLLIGQDSTLLSRYRVSSDPTVKQIYAEQEDDPRVTGFAAMQDFVNSNRTPLTSTIFSLAYPGFDLSQLDIILEADIINLHWVAYFQSPSTVKRLLALGKPIVWTLHDMWAFTGGCHYSAGCLKYKLDCVACPQLADDSHNLAAAILSDKLQYFSNTNLTIVTPSQWLADCVRQSRLFKHHRIEVIPYSLETDTFIPHPKHFAKQKLGIAPDVVTLLFGSDSLKDERKGFAELMQAMRRCLVNSEFSHLVSQRKIEILCFGYPSELLGSLEIPVRSLGSIWCDDQLSQIYSAADIFVLPSLEDNLPNTMLEAMSCGTPVVAFDVGGIPEVVMDRITGRLVPLRDAYQLGDAIVDCVLNPEFCEQMSQTCRQKMQESFALPIQAKEYLELYNKLLTSQVSSCSKTHFKTFTSNIDNEKQWMSESDPHVNSVPIETSSGEGLNRIFDEVAFKAVVTNLQQVKADYQQLQDEFQLALTQERQKVSQLQDEFQALQQTVQQLQVKLEESQHRIETMKSSKFWKLRSLWIKLKQKLGFEHT
ncbi:MAG: glycosyltransferase family 4 protein [Kovacikia sp.]